MSGRSRKRRSADERDERDVLVLEPRRRTTRSGAALAFVVIVSLLMLLIGTAGFIARYLLVDLRVIFTEEPYITSASIPWWNRPGSPIDDLSTRVWSFNYFVFATNAVDALPLIYVPASLLVALVLGLQSLGATFVQLVLGLIIVFQIVKFFYLLAIQYSFFGGNCERNAYCINRDLAQPADSPDPIHTMELYFQLGFAVFTVILVVFVPYAYRAATNATNVLVNAAIDTEDEEAVLDKFGHHIDNQTVLVVKH